ncbi:MAG: hypothetical protein ABIA12_01745 [Candidatus Aenigmatarchaeota archaeon]
MTSKCYCNGETCNVGYYCCYSKGICESSKYYCEYGTCVPSSTVTITLYKGENIIGVPGLTEKDFEGCDLIKYRSGTKEGCIYDNYFVYYNPNGNNKGDCDSNFFSTNTMEQGLGYYLYAGKQCDITFNRPTQGEVTLHLEMNLISVPFETSLEDVAIVGGDKNKIFTHYGSSTKAGCNYDKNGYFVYYDAAGTSDSSGDCGSRFSSESKMRPFVGYYVYSNGKGGDKTTQYRFVCKSEGGKTVITMP